MLNEVNFKGKDNTFAKRLRKLMEGNKSRKKTTQEELAKITGISRQSISQYMDGSSLPNIEKIYYIVKYFNVSADYLIFGLETKKADNHEVNKRLGLSDNSIRALECFLEMYRGNLEMDILNELLSKYWILAIAKYTSDQIFNLACEKQGRKYHVFGEITFLEIKKFTKFKVMDQISDAFDNICAELFPKFEKYLENPGKIFLQTKSKEVCADIRSSLARMAKKLNDLKSSENNMEDKISAKKK